VEPARHRRSRFRHSRAVETTGAGRRLHLSGQVGLRPDRSLPGDLDGRLRQCLANIGTALAAAAMTRGDIVEPALFLTQNTPQAVAPCRRIRDAWVGTAPLLYDAILAEARRRGLPRMTVPAGRLTERFLRKRGWRAAPELAAAPGEVAQNRAMALDLPP
jgi:enamine deaminase RidA (YjgF/YER057c/UK114 family)